MKKSVILSSLLGVSICCLAAYNFAASDDVNAEKINYHRFSNLPESSILKMLSVDDKMVIMEKDNNNWNQVSYTKLLTSDEGNTSIEEKNSETQNEVNAEEKVVESTTKKIIKGEKIYINSSEENCSAMYLEDNKEVNVMFEVNGWSYISFDNVEGWVRQEQLKNPEAENKQVYISKSSTSFKAQASSEGEEISKLQVNTKVEVLDETNGWVKVAVNGNIGYVENNNISDSQIKVTVRSSGYRRSTTIENSNATGSDIVGYARQFLGYRYVMGGASPSGFDCSGFTQYIYRQFGYSVSRIPRDQANDGIAVNKADLQPGDIICFSNSRGSSSIGHVGIYIGNGQFIHAANSRKGVIISNVDGAGFYYVCASRIIY